MKSLNDMNSINENEVDNIYECYLLYDIQNPSKHIKNINNHYYPIIHGCMKTCRESIYLSIFESYSIMGVVLRFDWKDDDKT